MSLTVMDVFRDLGLEPEPAVSWAVGGAVRRLYEAETGGLPPKELRQKTNGHGSHCFAAYPESWRSRIEGVIKQHQTQAARQGALF